MEKFQAQIKETLGGERLAFFLPMVHQLEEDYDSHAIAAAALQMVYDQNLPQWMQSDWEVPANGGKVPKPVISKDKGSRPQRQLPAKSQQQRLSPHHR
jgi:ATP-dependent RNA helicase DeaD